jgi:hypothetical protein
MKEQRNNYAQLYYRYCSGKAINFTYSEYVFVALVIQHAMSVIHFVICGLSGSTVLFRFIS